MSTFTTDRPAFLQTHPSLITHDRRNEIRYKIEALATQEEVNRDICDNLELAYLQLLIAKIKAIECFTRTEGKNRAFAAIEAATLAAWETLNTTREVFENEA